MPASCVFGASSLNCRHIITVPLAASVYPMYDPGTRGVTAMLMMNVFLQLDHHCLYIGRCVGKTNHRQFLLFLGFVWLGVLYMTIMTVFGLLQVKWKLNQFVVQRPGLGLPGMSPSNSPSAVWNQLDEDMKVC